VKYYILKILDCNLTTHLVLDTIIW